MFASLCYWLATWGNVISVTLANYSITFLNAAIVAFVAMIVSIVALFPAGPPLPLGDVTPTGSLVLFMLNVLNWCFPMQLFVTCLSFIVSGIAAYVVIAPLARWAKLLK